MYIDTSDQKFRQRFKQAAQKREYEMNVHFKRAGVDVLQVSTEDDIVREIVRFAMLRKQRKQLASVRIG
jgi:hypothetical protein